MSQHQSQTKKPHKNARAQNKSYSERQVVPDEFVAWEVGWSDYNPTDFTHQAVLSNDRTIKKGGWADPPNITIEELSQKMSYCTENHKLNIDPKTQKPLNPEGRTGLCGRGLLGKWGPNHAADPIVTRFNPTTNDPEMVAIQRRDTGEWAIPGGMVDDGETVSATLLREFQEEALALDNLECEGGDDVQEKRELAKKLVAELFATGGEKLYAGYVDDPRNTDNSWMETVCTHFHVGPQLAPILTLHAGDDAQAVRWLNLHDSSAVDALYASHAHFVRLALARMEKMASDAQAKKTSKAPSALEVGGSSTGTGVADQTTSVSDQGTGGEQGKPGVTPSIQAASTQDSAKTTKHDLSTSQGATQTRANPSPRPIGRSISKSFATATAPFSKMMKRAKVQTLASNSHDEDNDSAKAKSGPAVTTMTTMFAAARRFSNLAGHKPAPAVDLQEETSEIIEFKAGQHPPNHKLWEMILSQQYVLFVQISHILSARSLTRPHDSEFVGIAVPLTVLKTAGIKFCYISTFGAVDGNMAFSELLKRFNLDDNDVQYVWTEGWCVPAGAPPPGVVQAIANELPLEQNHTAIEELCRDLATSMHRQSSIKALVQHSTSWLRICGFGDKVHQHPARSTSLGTLFGFAPAMESSTTMDEVAASGKTRTKHLCEKLVRASKHHQILSNSEARFNAFFAAVQERSAVLAVAETALRICDVTSSNEELQSIFHRTGTVDALEQATRAISQCLSVNSQHDKNTTQFHPRDVGEPLQHASDAMRDCVTRWASVGQDKEFVVPDAVWRAVHAAKGTANIWSEIESFLATRFGKPVPVSAKYKPACATFATHATALQLVYICMCVYITLQQLIGALEWTATAEDEAQQIIDAISSGAKRGLKHGRTVSWLRGIDKSSPLLSQLEWLLDIVLVFGLGSFGSDVGPVAQDHWQPLKPSAQFLFTEFHPLACLRRFRIRVVEDVFRAYVVLTPGASKNVTWVGSGFVLGSYTTAEGSVVDRTSLCLCSFLSGTGPIPPTMPQKNIVGLAAHLANAVFLLIEESTEAIVYFHATDHLNVLEFEVWEHVSHSSLSTQRCFVALIRWDEQAHHWTVRVERRVGGALAQTKNVLEGRRNHSLTNNGPLHSGHAVLHSAPPTSATTSSTASTKTTPQPTATTTLSAAASRITAAVQTSDSSRAVIANGLPSPVTTRLAATQTFAWLFVECVAKGLDTTEDPNKPTSIRWAPVQFRTAA